MNQLTFHETEFAIVERDGQNWLTGLQIASALGYKNPSSDSNNLYNRHSEEFTPGMTQVVKLMSPAGYQDTRVFSLRGAHLLAMFARTERAAEFRRWVLDVLDAAVKDEPAVPPAPTFAPMDHGADILASADRTFRAMLRSCRAVGLRLPQAIGRANEATRRRTGVDILAEIDAADMVTAMSTRHSPTKELPLDDPLRPMALEWMAAHPEIGEIRSEDLVRAILANVSERQMRSAQMRLSVILRDLGWTKRKVGGSGPNLWVRPIEATA